jgi:regulator of sirC expression with transglutaminase-like and TPR domain
MHQQDIKIYDRIKYSSYRNGEYDNIGEVSLLLAKLMLPKNNLAQYLLELDKIASDMDLASIGVNTLMDQISTLTDVLYRQYGYHGDVKSYNDKKNANLMDVIDRRKGLPVALGILVIHAARSQKWNISGLNFPGHFLLQLSKHGENVIIDPFHEVRLMPPNAIASSIKNIYGSKAKLEAEFTRKVSDRDILIRLQNNIKSRALQEGDDKRAIEILGSMNLIAPMNLDIILELTSLESEQGYYQSAVRRLDDFLESYPMAQGVDRVLGLQDMLKSKLN